MEVLFAVFGGIVGALVLMSVFLLVGQRILAAMGMTPERTDGAALEPPAPPMLMKPDVAKAKEQAQATEALAARFKKLEGCLVRRYHEPPTAGTNAAFDEAAAILDAHFKAVIADPKALPDDQTLETLSATWIELVPEDPATIREPINWRLLLLLTILVVWLVLFFGGFLPGFPPQ